MEEVFATRVITDVLQSCGQYHPAGDIDYAGHGMYNVVSAELIQVMPFCWEEGDPYWKMNQPFRLNDINL